MPSGEAAYKSSSEAGRHKLFEAALRAGWSRERKQGEPRENEYTKKHFDLKALAGFGFVLTWRWLIYLYHCLANFARLQLRMRTQTQL